MKRVMYLAIPMLAACILALPADLSAGGKNKLVAGATVKSLTATELTVTAGGKDSTFSVDAKTRVVGKGIGTKARAKGGKAAITDLLAVGDRVSVTYDDAASPMRASKVEVMAAAAK